MGSGRERRGLRLSCLQALGGHVGVLGFWCAPEGVLWE